MHPISKEEPLDFGDDEEMPEAKEDPYINIEEEEPPDFGDENEEETAKREEEKEQEVKKILQGEPHC